jgi:hypothetical protein
MQEGLAQTWQAYRHYALDSGKVLSPGELVVMCGRRARDRSRHFVPRGKAHPNLDAMSEELARNRTRLKLGENAPPYFISYAVKVGETHAGSLSVTAGPPVCVHR